MHLQVRRVDRGVMCAAVCAAAFGLAACSGTTTAGSGSTTSTAPPPATHNRSTPTTTPKLLPPAKSSKASGSLAVSGRIVATLGASACSTRRAPQGVDEITVSFVAVRPTHEGLPAGWNLSILTRSAGTEDLATSLSASVVLLPSRSPTDVMEWAAGNIASPASPAHYGSGVLTISSTHGSGSIDATLWPVVSLHPRSQTVMVSGRWSCQGS